MNARRILLDVFDVALRAVEGRASVDRFLREANLPAPIEVFAVGKAASAMARGALVALGPKVERMLVITKDGHTDPALDEAPGVTQLQSSHPVPDLRSFSNGAELEERVKNLREGIFPLFLISGGSSSLVEALRDGVSLGEVQELNVQGLASGWDIARLNIARARLSRIKGGGIARLLRDRRALALFISDVPGDDPDVIGSGLLGHDVGIADGVERHVITTIETAVRAVQEGARAHGLVIEPVSTRFDGDVDSVAAELLARLRACDGDGIVWGGESTVTLPEQHGRGGRNTHLALSFARQLRAGEPWMLLAAGTDGTDGPTSDAGAIVDAGTIDRATIAGCDVERAWREFDSGTALEAAEDLVHTGPTGTNVGDILIAIKQSATSLRGQRMPRMH
jgi:hydroxypyruvate reductase